ncbi:hypothetical protein KM043_017072 [Ampulex compressa]|nr:hypothetical protein KM043_017072 [Ampulex compressa]
MMQSAFVKRSASTISNYEEAIKTLSGLQSNAAYLKSAVQNNISNDIKKLKDVERYLLRSGVTLDILDTLSVIHVAGTKGKGSTCAFTESILRKHGFRTGFFSSPHLISVRERIRINGEPVSQSIFTHYFWRLYKQLEDKKDHESDMPTYFKFLTVLMFNIFLEENIDVAIIEVGIGGEYDCTNIIRRPLCIGTIAYTVPQPEDAMQVLHKRATEKQCELQVIPSFESYDWQNDVPHLSITGSVQRQNASLAIQMAIQWMKSHSKQKFFDLNSVKPPCQFPQNVSVNKIVQALSLCKWPGRTQLLKSSSVDFFLDGAHTTETYFVPNLTGIPSIEDMIDYTLIDEQRDKCKIHCQVWGTNAILADNVAQVLHHIKQGLRTKPNYDIKHKPQVLVTGSLHLVGAVLSILDPHMTMTTNF